MKWTAMPATVTCSDIVRDGVEVFGSMTHINAMEVVRQLNQRDRFLAACLVDEARIKELEAALQPS